MARLPREFYLGDTVEIARSLLGKYLVRQYDGQILMGRITETEAYVGRCDKACHAYGYHKTPRNAVMFGEPGHAYLYFIYGMHCCLNLVTEPAGEPSAVLIRGLSAICGGDTIRRLRYGGTGSAAELTPYQIKNFLNGPGKICKGFSLSTDQNGMDLTQDELFCCETPADAGVADSAGLSTSIREKIVAGPRVGVDYAEEARDFPWRFTLTREV